MCGIAGIVSLKRAAQGLAEQTAAMLERLKHRGPDDEGFLLWDGKAALSAVRLPFQKQDWGNHADHPQTLETLTERSFSLVLGHRRLSILDTSANGHQPMRSDDGKIWLTFNGEIYNYLEIRQVLQKKGYQFHTGTDTEVVIKAYQAFGEKCLEFFNGMFAFVLFDSQRQRLWGARDRTGVKPFYFVKNEAFFAFASEQKALLSLSFLKKSINHAAVFDYFVFGTFEAAPQGFFEGILELMPSHAFYLDLTSSHFEMYRYFTPPNPTYYKKNNIKDFDNQVVRVRELVEEAIRLRLRSDVPLGSCLSGGLDSSTVVGVVHRLSGASLDNFQQVFTACFEDETWSEARWAAKVVERTKARWHQVFPTAEGLKNDLETVVYAQDIPIISTSTYAQFRVMQQVKAAGVKVVLDGQGADELFAGYSPHYVGWWQELLRHFQWATLGEEVKGYGGWSQAGQFWLKSWLKYSGLPHLPKAWRHQLNCLYFNELHYLNPDLLHQNRHRYDDFVGEKTGSLSQMLNYEYFGTPLKQLLKYEDRSSMWFSVEARTPFADDLPLMQEIPRLPSAFKIWKGTRKHILREAFKADLPNEIYARTDKMGFVTPANAWIREIKDSIRPYFEEQDDEIFNKKRLLNEFDQFFSPNSTVENYRIFKFISFALWRKVFQI